MKYIKLILQKIIFCLARPMNKYTKYDYLGIFGLYLIIFSIIYLGSTLSTGQWIFEEFFNLSKALTCIILAKKLIANRAVLCKGEFIGMFIFFFNVSLLAIYNFYRVAFLGEQISYIFNMMYHMTVICMCFSYSCRLQVERLINRCR